MAYDLDGHPRKSYGRRQQAAVENIKKWLADEAQPRRNGREAKHGKHKDTLREAVDFDPARWTVITAYTAAEQELIQQSTGPPQVIVAPRHFIPQQTDDYNCGIYVCLMTMFIHYDIPLQCIADLDPNQYRRKLASYILQGHIPKPTEWTVRAANRSWTTTAGPKRNLTKVLQLSPAIAGPAALIYYHQLQSKQTLRTRQGSSSLHYGQYTDHILLDLMTAADQALLTNCLAQKFLISAWHWSIARQRPRAHPYWALAQHLEKHAGTTILSVISPPTISRVTLAITDLTQEHIATTRIFAHAQITEEELSETRVILEELLQDSQRDKEVHNLYVVARNNTSTDLIPDTQVEAVLDTCVRTLRSLLKGTHQLKPAGAGNVETSKAILEELLQQTDLSGVPITRSDLDRIITVEETSCTERTQPEATVPLRMSPVCTAEEAETPAPRLFHAGVLFSAQPVTLHIAQPNDILPESPDALAHEHELIEIPERWAIASPTDFIISPLTPTAVAGARADLIAIPSASEPNCSYFALCRGTYDQDWDRHLPPEHERMPDDELHYLLYDILDDIEETYARKDKSRKRRSELQLKRDNIRLQHLRERAPLLTVLYDFASKNMEDLEQSLQRSNMHYRQPTVTSWLLEIDKEIRRLRAGDELGYNLRQPSRRTVTETRRCPVCDEIVSILEHSEHVLTPSSQDREEGIQEYLNKHYKNVRNLAQHEYIKWDRHPHLNFQEELCNNHTTDSIWTDSGPPHTIIIDLGEQINHRNKPRIPHTIQLNASATTQQTVGYSHTATLETNNAQLHCYIPEGRGWFTIDNRRTRRIPNKDLESLVQSAQPNVVIYTRAEHKAWIIEDMLVESPIKNQENKLKDGPKRSIQTTLLATGAIQCTAERFAPNNFPPQASPINRLIPQLITLNRPLRNSILREHETLCRQPERDIFGIIREGKVERWNHKRRIYQEIGIPWKASEPLSKAERMRVKRDRRMHNVIQQWPLYADWPGTLKDGEDSDWTTAKVY